MTNRDHKGKPSGAGKNQGRNAPARSGSENQRNQDQQPDRNTRNEQDEDEQVELRHPNRNVDKEDATGIGGYRS